jgi:uncharacterized membrane protein YphA (DoxX/SURF4 family)
MLDRRRQLGILAVFGLVLMRLAIGWHFYREGSAKLGFDRGPGGYRVAFSAEGFVSQAQGPLADWFRSFAPGEHDWRALLATPQQDLPSGGDATNEAYQDWATRITEDWKSTLARFDAISSLSDEQRQAAADVVAARSQQLADYLATEADAIAEYRHDLWRLEELRAMPEAGGVPFVDSRIAGQAAEVSRAPVRWVQQVAEFERELLSDLRQIASDKRRANATIAAEIEKSLTNPDKNRLRFVNQTVPVLLVGVGICLLVGLFTRLASAMGAIFLLGVVAAQPPWTAGALPTYYQVVELTGLFLLAATGAGRWAGLDYFGYALCARWCRRDKVTSNS